MQRHWAGLAKLAVWITAVIAGFLIEPPRLAPGAETPDWLRLSQFLIAVVAGLFFVGGPRKGKRAPPWRWIAIGAAVAGVAIFFTYESTRPDWTCHYRGRQVMVGDDDSLSKPGRDYRAKFPGTPCRRLIGTALGETKDLWPAEQLRRRYIVLCAMYTAAMLLFAVALMSTIEHYRSVKESDGAPEDRR